MRRDLPCGVQAAQIVHAAGESSSGNLPSGTNAVVLSVSSESELQEVGRRLGLHGARHVCIYEPDAPYRGALMAIGCHPAKKEVYRKLLSSLPLLR